MIRSQSSAKISEDRVKKIVNNSRKEDLSDANFFDLVCKTYLMQIIMIINQVHISTISVDHT